jgi:hypothetical protein
VAQDRNRWRALVNSVLKLWVSENAEKLSSVLTTGAVLLYYYSLNKPLSNNTTIN